MDDNQSINDKAAVDYIQQYIKNGLYQHIGTMDIKAVKQTLANTLNDISKSGIIENPYKDPKVYQLWSSWSFVKKLKWYFYNKAPIIKDQSKQIRDLIDDYNLSIYDNETQEYTETPKEYPELLQPSPKTIYITEVDMRLNHGIDFISLNVTLGDDNESKD